MFFYILVVKKPVTGFQYFFITFLINNFLSYVWKSDLIMKMSKDD